MIAQPTFTQNLNEKIDMAAKKILSLPKYSNQAHLMDQVVEEAKSYYSKPIFQKNFGKENQVDQKTLNNSRISLLKSFNFEIFSLSKHQKPEYVPKPLKDLSCFEYALMKAGVKEAFSEKLSRENILGLLDKWGFTISSKKESTPPDLVVFLNDQNLPVHMGIRYRDKILSKPGDLVPFSYVHDLDETISSYGNQVLFFKKRT